MQVVKIKYSKFGFSNVDFNEIMQDACYIYVLKSHPYKAIIVTKSMWDGYNSFQISIYNYGIGISSLSRARNIDQQDILESSVNVKNFFLEFIRKNHGSEYINPKIISIKNLFDIHIFKNAKIMSINYSDITYNAVT